MFRQLPRRPALRAWPLTWLRSRARTRTRCARLRASSLCSWSWAWPERSEGRVMVP